MKLELEKGRKVDKLLNFWSFYLYLSLVLTRLLTIEQVIFVALVGFQQPMADLSSSKFYLVYYVINRKIKAVELGVFSPVNLVLRNT